MDAYRRGDYDGAHGDCAADDLVQRHPLVYRLAFIAAGDRRADLQVDLGVEVEGIELEALHDGLEIQREVHLEYGGYLEPGEVQGPAGSGKFQMVCFLGCILGLGELHLVAVGIAYLLHVVGEIDGRFLDKEGFKGIFQPDILILDRITAARVAHGEHLGQQAAREEVGGRVHDKDLPRLGLLRTYGRGRDRERAGLRIGRADAFGVIRFHEDGFVGQLVFRLRIRVVGGTAGLSALQQVHLRLGIAGSDGDGGGFHVRARVGRSRHGDLISGLRYAEPFVAHGHPE